MTSDRPSPILAPTAHQPAARGYMIDSLRIKNFRGFRELALDNLGLVNVVVGANASGKTSLLEAIFLAAGGSVEAVTRLRLWRGLGPFQAFSPTRQMYESIWK